MKELETYLMKQIIIISFFIFLLPFQHGVFASDVTTVVEAIKKAKPGDWQLGNIDYANRPRWSRSDETCIMIELYGSALGRRQYVTSTGRLIEEKRFMNEAVRLWVTPKGFDSGWNFLTRFFYRFKPDNQGFPPYLAQYNGVEVFGEEFYYATPEDEKMNNMPAPEGTHTSYFYPPVGGRKWPDWLSDLSSAIRKLSPTSGSSGLHR